MANITIRNLDDTMEEEARLILRSAVSGVTGSTLWENSRALFSKQDGVELELPDRGSDRPAPSFD